MNEMVQKRKQAW